MMKTKAIRIYGKNNLQLEEFELPAMKDEEILARVVSDSICMSTYKAVKQGTAHKRIPDDVAENPTIIGHEFSGELVEVGKKWAEKFKPGQKFSIQPALNYKGSLDAPGYSFRWVGGDATYVILPNEVMEMDCLLEYKGPGYFPASLSEPLSCVIGAFHANYHKETGSYVHKMDIVEGGNMAILAGGGPMGLAAINYALWRDRKPGKLVVTDIDNSRLEWVRRLFSEEKALKKGVSVKYVNTANIKNPVAELLSLADGRGYDDVFIFAPVPQVIEQGDAILGRNGCLNFFAGPEDKQFSANINFYNVHYNSTHIVGTSGGNNRDMKEALMLMEQGLDPAGLVTHIGGLDAVIDTTLNLPAIPGGKKLIYTHISMPLTAIKSFSDKGKTNPLFRKLAEITEKNGGLWSTEAEEYLLGNARQI
ncbi:MAG: zinc-binding dehydrogenase [Bacteroidetes bacterium]|nr:zinc-binding dehydrogenase [Bacteroidota bacterium]